MGKAGSRTAGERGGTIKSPREEANWRLEMGTWTPPGGTSLHPGRCVQGGNRPSAGARLTREGQDQGGPQL